MTTQQTERPEQETSDQERRAIAVGSHGASQNTLHNVRLIIGREYKNRLTQRSFIITSIILLIVIFLLPFIPTIIQWAQSRGAPSQTHLVVVNEAGPVAGMDETALLGYINAQLNGTKTASAAPFAISDQSTDALAGLQDQVKQGKLDILLEIDRSAQGDLQFVYDASGAPSTDSNLSSMQTLAQLLTVVDTAHRLGLSPAQTAHLLAPVSLTTMYPQQNQDTRPVGQIAAIYILAYVGVILIYISVGVYGSIVAGGVAEEKSSRVMEILVNAATPFQLLAGKILGIGLACLTQMGAVVVVGIGSLLLQAPLQHALFGASSSDFSKSLISVSLPFYLLFLVYVLLAFFLYSTLYAGLGAMVRRQDEVQNATMIPSLLILSGYLLFYVVIYTPNADWVRVLSFMPFWTPMFMLARIAQGAVAWWEVPVSIGVMLVAIVVCTWFAARIYRLGVLMYGQRPSFGQLLKLARMR